ncbi:hypothetical protein RB195_004118 [Necator americanus]|uniref:Uncharacterized protein n=1 Tax=Necator americanus TaxID=51031 RepID=A0ABR1BIJ1_NECAM
MLKCSIIFVLALVTECDAWHIISTIPKGLSDDGVKVQATVTYLLSWNSGHTVCQGNKALSPLSGYLANPSQKEPLCKMMTNNLACRRGKDLLYDKNWIQKTLQKHKNNGKFANPKEKSAVDCVLSSLKYTTTKKGVTKPKYTTTRKSAKTTARRPATYKRTSPARRTTTTSTRRPTTTSTRRPTTTSTRRPTTTTTTRRTTKIIMGTTETTTEATTAPFLEETSPQDSVGDLNTPSDQQSRYEYETTHSADQLKKTGGETVVRKLHKEKTPNTVLYVIIMCCLIAVQLALVFLLILTVRYMKRGRKSVKQSPTQPGTNPQSTIAPPNPSSQNKAPTQPRSYASDPWQGQQSKQNA